MNIQHKISRKIQTFEGSNVSSGTTNTKVTLHGVGSSRAPPPLTPPCPVPNIRWISFRQSNKGGMFFENSSWVKVQEIAGANHVWLNKLTKSKTIVFVQQGCQSRRRRDKIFILQLLLLDIVSISIKFEKYALDEQTFQQTRKSYNYVLRNIQPPPRKREEISTTIAIMATILRCRASRDAENLKKEDRAKHHLIGVAEQRS